MITFTLIVMVAPAASVPVKPIPPVAEFPNKECLEPEKRVYAALSSDEPKQKKKTRAAVGFYTSPRTKKKLLCRRGQRGK